MLEQAEKYYELAEKPDLPEKVKIQKHSCWQTMLKNGIMMQYDYDVLNDCANNFLQQNLKAARKSKSPFAEI